MSKNWKYFLHLSDTHLCENAQDFRLGSPPYSNLNTLISYIQQNNLKLDFVIHSGDIAGGSELGHPLAYKAGHNLLCNLGVPIYYVNGNHDDPLCVKDYLPEGTELLGMDKDRLAYSFIQGDARFFVLDARIGEAPDSLLPDDQINGLNDGLNNLKEKLAFVITHYQVMSIDVPSFDCIDRNGKPSTMLMKNGADLHKILVAHQSRVKAVFHGHIHCSVTWSLDGITYYCAPSTDTNFSNWPGEKSVSVRNDGLIGANLVGFSEEMVVVRHLQIKTSV